MHVGGVCCRAGCIWISCPCFSLYVPYARLIRAPTEGGAVGLDVDTGAAYTWQSIVSGAYMHCNSGYMDVGAACRPWALSVQRPGEAVGGMTGKV